jgi:glycogen debranching enzyme
VFSGYTVLCSGRDGAVAGPEQGLFHRDTRVLSKHELTIGRERPDLVSASQPESDRWFAVLRLPRPGGRPEGPQLPQDALEVVLDRTVGPGLVETIRVRNHSAIACRTVLHLAVDADFADFAEVGGERQQVGKVTRSIQDGKTALRFDYRVQANERSDKRGLLARVGASGTPPSIDGGGFRFELDLDGAGSWTATLTFAVLDRGTWVWPDAARHATRGHQRETWRRHRPTVTGAERLSGPFVRAADDLFDLRNWELEDQLLGSRDGARWVLNAGVPMFTGLFGRDVVTAGWQSAMLGTRALAGAIEAVAVTQADADDPWRDAEPGKLIHEKRSGQLASLGLTPRDAYYGSQTTPAMFVLALSEHWHWTGDDGFLVRHLDVAKRAMAWARQFGDLDGDGLLEYRRRSPGGLRNQAWKDSDEAIRHGDGSIADGPIATVEEQAFYILALERMAEILIAVGDERGHHDALTRARELRRRWHDAYWMPGEGFYAMALDGHKDQVRSVGSNPGHALGTGVVPRRHAEAVADRLLAPDLFSGWGVRSLSDRHPSYNPFAYHLGSVWPVEQATFALGFKRYGLDRQLDRLVDAMFDAANSSPEARLPEALSGHARAEMPAPIPYPAANVPQAWSASALVQLVQIMLGLYPFAPLRVLAVVRPRLPIWAPEVTLRGLRVGRAVVDLRFDRRADGFARWHVLRQRGPLLVIPAGPPDDVGTGSILERLELSALSLAPGRLASAARIAMGRI